MYEFYILKAKNVKMNNQTAIEIIKTNKQKISDLINSFSESIENKNCKDEILKVFHKLSYFSSEIFIGEELLMKKHGIESITEHTKEHNQFVEKIKYFQQQYENKEKGLCVELLDYLKKWHDEHVLKTDETLIEYLTKISEKE